MMEVQTEILVVGTNSPILQTVIRLLNTKAEWNATGACNAEKALEACSTAQYQVLLIGGGLTAEEEKQLEITVKELYPAIHVIPHYGGGSGLLFAEIYLALGKS
jgi:DNA-binding NtrC family response regulator